MLSFLHGNVVAAGAWPFPPNYPRGLAACYLHIGYQSIQTFTFMKTHDLLNEFPLLRFRTVQLDAHNL